MHRNCVKYLLDEFLEENNIVGYENIHLHIDEEQEQIIKDFLIKNNAHFARVIYQILQGRYHEDHYSKEPFDTTAIKFKGNKNPRIYCKEYSKDGIKHIVLIHLLDSKKTQKVDKRISSILKSISQHTYSF